MIPSVVARQVRETVLDYLRTTFALADPEFESALFDFLDSEEGLFKGPYVDIQLPFRKAEEGGENPPRDPTRLRALQAPAQGLPAPLLEGRPPAPAHARHHGYRFGQDRVLPLPDPRPLLARAGEGRASRPSFSTP